MNNRGTIAVMSAILAIPILLGFGLALDASCLWLLRQRMQWAVDAAALLGASQTNGETADLVTKDAKELFWASYGAPLTSSSTAGTQVGFLGSSSAGATVIPSTDPKRTCTNPCVTVTASATLPTFIMRIAGQQSSTVTTTGVAAVPHKVEMTLVLDNSLSMGLAINGASSKLAAMQTAANNLLTTILGSGSSPSPNVFIGVVPFAGAVNIGTDPNIQGTFLKTGTQAKNFSGLDGSNLAWRGCVQARAYATGTSYDTTEDAPTSEALKFDPYFYPSTYRVAPDPKNKGSFYPGDNDWIPGNVNSVNDTSTAPQSTNTNYLSPINLYYGPNLFCPHVSLVKLTNNKTTLSNSINNMIIVNGGGTIINQGLQWGWFTLSPLWTAWGLPASPTGAARPAAYTDTGTTKIIVLMTDGVSEVDGIDSFYGANANCSPILNMYPECVQPDSWYTSYQRVTSGVLTPMPAPGLDGTTLRNNAKLKLKLRLQTLCSNIKAKNVILYTIFFHGSQDDQILQATANGAGPDLQSCATDASHYFDSQSATAINTAFQTIAQNINDLRVTQ